MTVETIDPRTLDLSDQSEYNRIIYILEKELRAINNDDEYIASRLLGILIALGYRSHHLKLMGGQARMSGREVSRIQHLLEFFHVRETRYADKGTRLSHKHLPEGWLPFIEEGKILLMLSIEAENQRKIKADQAKPSAPTGEAIVVPHSQAKPPSIAPSEPDDSEIYKQKYKDAVYAVYGLCFVCGLLLVIVGTHAKEWFK